MLVLLLLSFCTKIEANINNFILPSLITYGETHLSMKIRHTVRETEIPLSPPRSEFHVWIQHHQHRSAIVPYRIPTLFQSFDFLPPRLLYRTTTSQLQYPISELTPLYWQLPHALVLLPCSTTVSCLPYPTIHRLPYPYHTLTRQLSQSFVLPPEMLYLCLRLAACR